MTLALPNVNLHRAAPIVPRDDLFRMIAFRDLEAEGLGTIELREDDAPVDSIGILAGFMAVFRKETVIDSWEGQFRELFEPGSFTTTLAQRGDRIKVLFNHGFDPSIGEKPLGKPRSIVEKVRGLWHETPLDDTSYNRDLKASLRSGALDGQSIRFSVLREDWEDLDKELPLRRVQEVRLYEGGPVTFPAYEATTAGVRSRQGFELWRSRPINPDGPGDPASPPAPAPAPADSGSAGVNIARDRAITRRRLSALASL